MRMIYPYSVTRHASRLSRLTVVAPRGLAEEVTVVVERAVDLGEQAIEHWSPPPGCQH